MNAQPLEGSAFARFMASAAGRAVRLGLGLALLAVGLLVGGWPGIALGVAALVPLTAGALNLCPIAPTWGGHFLGSRYCAARRPRQ